MANDPSQPPVPSETLLRIGPILIGSLLSWMLFGISIVQLYIYHVSFTRDRRAIVISVYTIFALDVFQSIVVASEAWQALCAGWGRPINLRYPGWTFVALPIVSSIIAVWVQIFYAWRIRQLSRWKLIPIIIVITGLAQTGAACAIAISFIWLQDIETLHETSMFARTIVWLGGSAFADLTIMFSMLYLLYNVKRRSKAFERSGLVVNRLIRMSVETGCACALSAVLELGFFLGLPNTNIHLIVALILSKVYSNTLMTSLNSRSSHTRSKPPVVTDTSMHFRNTLTEDSASQDAVAINITPGAESEAVASDKRIDDELAKTWDVEMNDIVRKVGGST